MADYKQLSAAPETTTPEAVPPEAIPAASFIETHCRNCAMGWTRTGEKGGKILTWCLLTREAVWPQIESCDRYELREPETKAA